MPAAHSTQQEHPSSQASSAPPATLPVAVWGATDKGRQREGNEDAVYPHSGADTFPFEPGADKLAKKGHLLVVADGVGGSKAGAEASRWAIRVAVERFYDLNGPDLGSDLRTAVEVANTSLFQYLQSTQATDAGSTMVAAVIHDNTLQVANVGDSRAYLIRNGQITRLTRDHTLTQQKIDNGVITPEQAETDPDRSVLTRSMGAGPNVKVDLFQPVPLVAGDVVLLCSDGLSDMVDDPQIAHLVSGGSPKRIVQRLIAAANNRGGYDNISVVGGQIGGKSSSVAGFWTSLSNLRVILAAVAALAIVAILVALSAWGWTQLRDGQKTPTATPLAAQATTPANVTPATPAETPEATELPVGDQPTSTPVPTLTPTPTPRPDRDNDGVPDRNDQCPNEAGLPQFDGCPDRDGDGIRDGEDDCPDEAGLPQFDGCPDKDGDGTPDNVDVCPDFEGPPENYGCPLPRDDGDDGGGEEGGGDGGDDGKEDAPPPSP